MTLIRDLISEGVLKWYFDGRSGTLYDWSETGNTAVQSDVTFGYDGVTFDGATSVVAVADDATLKGVTEGTLAFMASSFDADQDYRLLSKRDGSGAQYDWWYESGQIKFYDGTSIRVLTADVSSARMLTLIHKNTETPELFVNDESVGDLDGTTSISDDTADLLVGNYYALTGAFVFPGTLQAAFYASRQLTAAEIADIYAELLTTEFGNAGDVFQEGDVDLTQTVNGGDIDDTGGIIRMTGRFGTAAYLAMFGGNDDDPGGDDATLSWWGNLLETDTTLQYRSQTQNLLKTLPLNSANRLLIERAVLADLEFFKTIDAASVVEVEVLLTALNRIRIICDIQALGLRESFEFTSNWEAPQ